MDDFKLNKIGTNSVPAQLQQPVVRQHVEKMKVEGVSVTNHMSKLIHLLGGDEASPEESARVQAAKNLVDSGQYTVDDHALSEKLFNSGLLNIF